MALSRVTLGDGVDPIGQPVPRLDWRLTDLEPRTVRVMQEHLDLAFRELGWGRVVGLLGEEYPRRVFRGEWHQMGTTRMSEDMRHGVVDRDCRVHGMDNLYVAGSSVFPTVGYANPTLTIVALSMRLAHHLNERLDPAESLGPIW
jgi:choline dehydrogenase-like flavoprotein